MYFLALFLGAGAAFLSLILQVFGMVIAQIMTLTPTPLVAILLLATVEEALKALFVFLRARSVLSGVCVGIGFAAVETALRFFGAGLAEIHLWLLVSTPLVHVLSGALYGFVVAHRASFLPYAVLTYTAVHGYYNLTLLHLF